MILTILYRNWVCIKRFANHNPTVKDTDMYFRKVIYRFFINRERVLFWFTKFWTVLSILTKKKLLGFKK